MAIHRLTCEASAAAAAAAVAASVAGVGKLIEYSGDLQSFCIFIWVILFILDFLNILSLGQ